MLNLFIDYSKWHYTYALLNIFRLAVEFVRFFLNLFSVKLFLKSLFSPLFSVPLTTESNYYGDIIAGFVGGTLVRIIGALFRSVLIICGLGFSLVTIIFFFIAFVIWLILPLVILVTLYYLFTLTQVTFYEI